MIQRRLRTRIAGLIGIPILLGGCAATLPAGQNASRGAGPAPESRIYDSKAHRFIEMPAFINALSSADIVFFGEQHDDPATHRAELAYLAAAGAKRANVVVSVEMFERDVQRTLDAYLAGQITDSVFNATSRPWPNYISDYRPLVEIARAHGWPVIAANVPRRLASAVGKTGLKAVDSLDMSTRALIAKDLQCPHDKYYERFAEEMTGHSAGAPAATDSKAVDAKAAEAKAALDMTNRFYEAQCVKDETMAESIVSAFDRAGADALLMHFNGAFHSNMGLGTVARVARRKPNAKIIVVSAVPVDNVQRAEAATYAELGDYILLTPKPPKAH